MGASCLPAKCPENSSGLRGGRHAAARSGSQARAARPRYRAGSAAHARCPRSGELDHCAIGELGRPRPAISANTEPGSSVSAGPLCSNRIVQPGGRSVLAIRGLQRDGVAKGPQAVFDPQLTVASWPLNAGAARPASMPLLGHPNSDPPLSQTGVSQSRKHCHTGGIEQPDSTKCACTG
jgi:hypothetical protein